MTNIEFVSKLKDIADNYKTVYMWGSFGSPVTRSFIDQKAKQSPKWYNKNDRIKKLNNIADSGRLVFGFDCICLAKGILWGWDGSTSKYGGARYLSNGVPDLGANYTETVSYGVSTDFSNIEIGEAVWMKNHIGFYIGGGIVIEATPKWDNCVQRSNILNVERIPSMSKSRTWVSHGRLPWIEYVTKESDKSMTLYKGLKNDRVKQLQIDLIELGYSLAPYGADGSFGSLTDTVVRQFQRDNGLEVDGRVGGKTRAKLAELLEESNTNQEDEEIVKLETELAEANNKLNKIKEILGV